MDFKPLTYWEHEDFSTLYQHGLMPHREYLLDLLKSKGVHSIFDVGCGTGPIYELIKDTHIPTEDGFTTTNRWDFKYKGTDYSRTMIETAKREFPEGDWEVQDARSLTEPADSWDCVLLMHALDHLDDYEAAIKEAARVSKRYVCIVLWRTFVSDEEYTHLNNRNTYGREEGEWEDTHLQEFSKKALGTAYKKAGLKIVHEKEVGGDYSKYNYIVLLEK